MRQLTRIALRCVLGLLVGSAVVGLVVVAAAPALDRSVWIVGGTIGLVAGTVAAIGPDRLCELFKAAYGGRT